ncbi:AAA family ATPase [Isoptericola sp. NPDC056605]|uniref:AAA family ATPase n=1 Tax=Isoptericola sp. NPDC056605 TaxID=3345876 RepID=UPI00367D60E0
MRTIPTLRPATPDPAPSTPGPPPASAPALAAPPPHPAAVILDDPTTAGVLHSAWSGDPAVVVPSPPGAGKTRLVALLAAMLAVRADLRVGIAAQTRDQAAEIARRLGALDYPARLVWPAKQPAPDLDPGGAARVVQGRSVRYPNSGGGVIIATTARWTYADPRDLACDVMIVDEAWQATYADLGALGAFAAQVVCVGDPGQIDPVVTGQTRRWADSPTGPHVPAPVALRAAHGDAVSVVTLRHTWRLGPDTTALIQPAFYPDLPFTSRRPPEHLTDAHGDRLPEITGHAVTANAGPGDPALTNACASATRDLLTTALTTDTGTRPVTPGDLAVVTAHVSQAAAIRAMLSDLPDVLVGTANQLQGMERPAAVVLHPLAGYREASGFGTDLGRTCVMLSRHRAHLTVIADASTRTVLRAADPTTATSTHLALADTLGL